MSGGSPVLRASGVDFRFGSDVALTGVDLEIGAGERLAILGPNGGGKTTLVRLLLGLLAPSRGEIRWTAAPRPRLGYVPQFPAFDRAFPLRVAEMVGLGLLRARRSIGRDAGAERARVDAMLERLDLVALRDAYLSELSGGETKRALIARALVGDPGFLVLDEPAASLDEVSRRSLWALVGALPAETVVLLVTHDLAPGTFAPTRAVLVDGRLETLPIEGLHQHPVLCGHGHG
jgi:zinc transport system ATP-binding protein